MDVNELFGGHSKDGLRYTFSWPLLQERFRLVVAKTLHTDVHYPNCILIMRAGTLVAFQTPLDVGTEYETREGLG